ncbi:LamG-like jellyroll fold domain-containing protein [Micromonospora sp. LOL_014]|uniref:LamG domain-containing protein n=1 Tax=Micromonospora sp. LOL_014 TaxID=3345415 RepID=UPI003A852023
MPAPTVTSVDYPDDGVSHGGRDVAGEFTFSTSSPDVVAYVYGWSSPAGTTVTVAPGASVTLTLTPPRDGFNALYVYARNEYGRPSPTTRYPFLVTSRSSPIGHWPLIDTNNELFRARSGGPDLVPSGDVTWAPDTYLIEASTPAFDAVAEDPVDVPGAATAAVSALDTSGSFSAAAWVRPAELSGDRTAVGADGTGAGGFQLGIRQLGDPPAPHWAFTVPTGTAASSPLISAYRPVPIAASDVDRWTHLTGVFDADEGLLRLYVNGALVAEAAFAATPWQAAGPFTVGRGFSDGAPAQWWAGGVTDVLLWSRVADLEDLHGRFADPGDTLPELFGVLTPRQVGLWGFDYSADCWCGDEFDLGSWGRNLYLAGWDTVPETSGFVHDSGAPTGHAAWFDGTSGYASTTSPYDPVPRPVLRTDHSFGVLLWARLDGDPADPLPGSDAVVLAQGGDETDAFQLGYRASDGRWVFRLRGADDAGLPDLAVAASPAEAVPGQWTHLAGVYDAGAATLTLIGESCAGRVGVPTLKVYVPAPRIHIEGLVAPAVNRSSKVPVTNAGWSQNTGRGLGPSLWIGVGTVQVVRNKEAYSAGPR